MAGMMNGIKMEDDTKVKPEPDSPTGFADDIEDEDTGELQIPKDLAAESGWLIQVPKEVSRALDALKDDDKVEIGVIKLWKLSPNDEGTFRLELHKHIKPFEPIPKQYDLTRERRTGPKNAFVFTEKNLPGFKPHVLGRDRVGRQRAQDAHSDKMGSPYRVDKARPRGLRIIPKHTALYTIPSEEIRCTPRENEEWRQLQQAKVDTQPTEAPFSEIDPRVLHDVGAGRSKADQMQGFIMSNVPKKRTQENKAIRMPKMELIKVLGQKFQTFKFWPLKTLKHDTKQPEAFLKEVLSEIGYLVREGPAANRWGLKYEYAASLGVDFVTALDAKADSIAKEEEFDEEEEEEEMEEVKIEGR